MTIKSVCAVPLLDGVGATFVEDDDGWRFQDWHQHDGHVTRPPPTKADQQRYFETCEAAAKFFREQYADWLR